MKRLGGGILGVGLLLAGATAAAGEGPVLAGRVRVWQSDARDENSIHAVGNGQIIALAAGQVNIEVRLEEVAQRLERLLI